MSEEIMINAKNMFLKLFILSDQQTFNLFWTWNKKRKINSKVCQTRNLIIIINNINKQPK